MDSSGSIFVDIFEIYRRYCDIWSRKEKENSRQELVQLLTLVELRKETCLVFDELLKLISHLDLSVDSCRFTCFYDFVYFMCRERGQKNITIEKAIMAWNFVLKGRFRLLNEWCNFVEKHQRHNISEDTWQQVLAFSRCVHEDLEGYDPKGAWPVLIDDFVDHMHRVNQSNSCGNHRFSCKCGGDSRAQACMSDDGFRGLKLFSGTKRKPEVELSDSSPGDPMCVESLFISKRSRQTESPNKPTYWDIALNNDIEISKHGSPLGPILNSACAVEGSLAEGFAGLLSAGGCWQLDHKSRFPYT